MYIHAPPWSCTAATYMCACVLVHEKTSTAVVLHRSPEALLDLDEGGPSLGRGPPEREGMRGRLIRDIVADQRFHLPRLVEQKGLALGAQGVLLGFQLGRGRGRLELCSVDVVARLLDRLAGGGGPRRLTPQRLRKG